MTEGAATFRVAADAYDRFVGRYSPSLSAALIGIAAVEPGMRVLDVGCGPGGLTRALADRVGGENVAAIDPSEPFVEACHARVPDADVRIGAAEDLPFADGSFDRVLSQLVVNFMADAERGVREMARVSVADGRVAACVWDYGEGMTMLRTFWDAALEIDPEAEDEGRTMRYGSRSELEALWRSAGLEDVETGQLVATAEYESFDDLWAPLPTGVGPAGAFCASLDPERQDALRASWSRRLGDPHGSFGLEARAWYVVGRAA
jgi:SAM-dependent methyltransferase